MYEIAGVLGLLSGVIVLVLSIFWPDLTRLGIVFLSMGALSCSGNGLKTNDRMYSTLWTAMGIVSMCFVIPFYVVFGQPIPPMLALLVGLILFCLTIIADQRLGRANSTPGGSISNIEFLPVWAFIAAVGTCAALLLRWLQERGS